MNYLNRGKYLSVLIVIGLLAVPLLTQAQNRQLTFEDIMKWTDISDPIISDDGEWLAYNVWPDRGDGEVRIRRIDANTMYSIPRGKNPRITTTGQWVGAYLKPPLAEQIKAQKKKPKQGLALLNTANGKTITKDSVDAYQFSNDGRWVAIQFYQSEKKDNEKNKNEHAGSDMLLRNLETGQEHRIPFVKEAVFDSTASYIAYSVVDTAGAGNGLYYRNLEDSPARQQEIAVQDDALFANLSWDDTHKRLAFTQAAMDTTFETEDAHIRVWEASKDQVNTLVDPADVEEDWALRTNNDLEWTDDGNRLFFGLMPQAMVSTIQENKQDDEPDSIKIYDRQQILAKKELDIWNHKDPRIKPREKNIWDRRKKETYRAVYHMKKGQWVQLADRAMPNVAVSQNPNVALGRSNVPYLQAMTWEGRFSDYYIVDLQTGERTRIAKRTGFGAQLSPDGAFAVFYQDKNWHLYNVEEDLYRNLTEDMETPFYNEDHDYPSDVPGYGIAGWTAGDNSVLIYDKFDIWKFSTDGQKPVNLTQDGRKRDMQYRIQDMDKERDFFEPDEKLLVRGYYDHKKTYGFYTLALDEPGTEKQLETAKKYSFVAKAKDADRIIYSRESYDEYPNLWISDDIEFKDTKRVTSLHLDLHDTYNWGKAELIEWNSMDDGRTIQGAVIKPDDYEEGKKYPVLVYFYRFVSQRAYEFNNITNDDRPTLPQWVSDNYVVFLPDIRFKVGTPGFSSTKSLVPGVQKLIEMGIADPDKLGLHGHSWGGYQTAFIITQTNIFDAAIAGAPVSNMTSAYSGIRLGSGLARQFQYEKTQSRLGGSLWEYPERYIENSPLFYADRITTPLLIMSGDEDTAVPWEQDIELYLGMLRLHKNAIFLQYRGEPHHLQKYANKLDYAIKMKQYFDHYLRGEDAPAWITDGVPYRGK